MPAAKLTKSVFLDAARVCTLFQPLNHYGANTLSTANHRLVLEHKRHSGEELGP